jgi:hypothetical protein
MTQQARLIHARSAIDWKNIQGLIVDYDRGLPAAPLVIAANELSIPTFTLVHGDPNPESYVPFLARHVLCWSDHQAVTLQHWDSHPWQKHVTGAFWVNRSWSDRAVSDLNCLLVHTGVESIGSFLMRNAQLIDNLVSMGRAVRVRPHPLARGQRGRRGDDNFELSTNTIDADLTWAAEVFSDASSVALEAFVAGCHVAVPLERNGLRLASLERIPLARVAHPISGWGWLSPSFDDSWPYRAMGATALALSARSISSAITIAASH